MHPVHDFGGISVPMSRCCFLGFGIPFCGSLFWTCSQSCSGLCCWLLVLLCCVSSCSDGLVVCYLCASALWSSSHCSLAVSYSVASAYSFWLSLLPLVLACCAWLSRLW